MQVIKDTKGVNNSLLHGEVLNFLRQKKQERQLHQVASTSGVSYSSITKILSGITKQPSALHCEKILNAAGYKLQLIKPDSEQE